MSFATAPGQTRQVVFPTLPSFSPSFLQNARASAAQSPAVTRTSSLARAVQPQPQFHAPCDSTAHEFTPSEVSGFTEGFSDSLRIGKFSVYRGTLEDGETAVAVKRGVGNLSEIALLAKHRHPHIVSLLGFARLPRSEICLVLEFMEGGDLASCLHVQKNLRNFRFRVTILKHTLQALCFLHSRGIFHRDLKTMNILIDRFHTCAKISDLGLAIQAPPRSSLADGVSVAQVSGTQGYADPVYIHSKIFTQQSEIYSFGMVVLETLCALPPALHAPGQAELVYNFRDCPGEEAVLARLDALAQWPDAAARALARLALTCAAQQPRDRPATVQDVLQRLKRIEETLASAIPSPSGSWTAADENRAPKLSKKGLSRLVDELQ